MSYCPTQCPNIFFSLISIVHFGDKAVQEAGHTFLFPLGSELGGKGRHTDRIGFQRSRVVQTWWAAELSVSRIVGKFWLGSSSSQWSPHWLLPPQMWRTPPPALSRCGHLMYPFWALPLFCWLAVVTSYTGLGRGVLLAKKGNGTSVYQGVLSHFIYFTLLSLFLNGFLSHLLRWCLQAGSFHFSATIPLMGSFQKTNLTSSLAFYFLSVAYKNGHDLAFAHLSNIFSSTRPAWYLCSVLQLYLCFIVCLESIFPPPLPCTLSHRPAPPCPSKPNALISFR